MVVLDVPLLYETRGDRRCDAVLVVSAPRAIQALEELNGIVEQASEEELCEAAARADQFRATFAVLSRENN